MTSGKKRSNRGRRAQARRQWGKKSQWTRRAWHAARRRRKGQS